jgi:hypothetical protein
MSYCCTSWKSLSGVFLQEQRIGGPARTTHNRTIVSAVPFPRTLSLWCTTVRKLTHRDWKLGFPG